MMVKILLLCMAFVYAGFIQLTDPGVSTSTVETGKWATKAKTIWVVPEYSGDWEILFDSQTMNFENGVYVATVTLILDNTYYVVFQDTVTGFEFDNIGSSRSVYVNPSYFGSTVIYHANWALNPPPPSLIVASYTSISNVYISWNAPTYNQNLISDMEGGIYAVYRSTLFNMANAILVDTVPYSINEYNDSTVTPGSNYYYAVKAIDAYIPGLESNFSNILLATGTATPFIVDIFLDVADDFDEVYIKANFTEIPFAKTNMNRIGDRKYRFRYEEKTPSKLLQGSTITYKFYGVKGDGIFEEPQIKTNSGMHEVFLSTGRLTGSKMLLEVFDVWGMETIDRFVKKIPEPFVFLSGGVKSGNMFIRTNFVKDYIESYSLEVYDESFNFLSSTTLNSIRASTLTATELNSIYGSSYSVVHFDTYTLLVPFEHIEAISPGATRYVRISYNGEVSDYLKIIGNESYTSVIPELEVITGNLEFDSFPSNTGVLTISFYSPAEGSYGKAHSYIVFYATFPVNSSNFTTADIARVFRGFYPGKLNSVNTNILGRYCPGFYFSIGAIYTYNNKNYILLSNPVILTAGIKKRDGVFVKGSDLLGDIPGVVADVEFPKINFIPNIVIKNAGEIGKDFSNAVKKTSVIRARVLSDRIYEYSVYASSQKYFSNGERLAKPAKIKIYFSDVNSDGILDGSDVSVSSLRVYKLVEDGGFFKFLPGGVDLVNKYAYADVDSFSYFALGTIPAPAGDLSNVQIYPNPYKPQGTPEEGGGGSGIVFQNLTKNSKIEIYTISMEKVKTHELAGIDDNERQGKWIWDAKNDWGEEVASGLYIVFIKDETIDGINTWKGKLAIIR